MWRGPNRTPGKCLTHVKCAFFGTRNRTEQRRNAVHVKRFALFLVGRSCSDSQVPGLFGSIPVVTYQVTFNQFPAALYQGFQSFLVTRPTTTLSVKFKLNLGIIIWNCNMRLKISTDSQWFCGKRCDEHVGMCTARRVRLQSFPTASPVWTCKGHWVFTFHQRLITVWWKP